MLSDNPLLLSYQQVASKPAESRFQAFGNLLLSAYESAPEIGIPIVQDHLIPLLKPLSDICQANVSLLFAP